MNAQAAQLASASTSEPLSASQMMEILAARLDCKDPEVEVVRRAMIFNRGQLDGDGSGAWITHHYFQRGDRTWLPGLAEYFAHVMAA